MSEEDKISRRKTLQVLGFGAMSLTVVGTAAPAGAQVKADPALLSVKLSDARAVRTLQLTKRLPASTPVANMLNPEGARSLTAGARTLTKADLVAMQTGKIPAAAAKLTVRDIQSIQGAFANPSNLRISIDISCCCCTPCCCAAAVEPELALAA